MLNTTAILDQFESAITDNTPELRARALVWLNILFKRIAQERDWNFLKKTATLAIASSKVALPTDYKRIVYCQGDTWQLTDEHRYSQQELFALRQTTAETPTGWYNDSQYLYFAPAGTTSTTCNLTYIQSVPTYTDSAADTLFPDESELLVIRMLIASFYEYDFDERYPTAVQAVGAQMRDFKHWDNLQKPIPQYFTATTVTNYAP